MKSARILRSVMVAGLMAAWIPAMGANQADDTNIFTPPPDQQHTVPTFRESGDDKLRRAFLGHKSEGGLGMFNRIRNIPSLTPQQRKQIVAVFTKAKSDFEPIKEQLDALKSEKETNPQKVMADPQMHDRFLDLRRQVRDLHKRLEDQVDSILTDEQKQELEAMRKGEMTPATFNEPMTGLDPLRRGPLNPANFMQRPQPADNTANTNQ